MPKINIIMLNFPLGRNKGYDFFVVPYKFIDIHTFFAKTIENYTKMVYNRNIH